MMTGGSGGTGFNEGSRQRMTLASASRNEKAPRVYLKWRNAMRYFQW